MSGFTGWPEEALDFYEGLEADNSKAYWTAHQGQYESAVRAPMLALLASLEPEFGAAKVFRPYRDVRFAKDKAPYKTNAAAVVGGGRYYVSLSATGLAAGGGWHSHASTPDRVATWRAAVDADRSGTALVAVVAELEDRGYGIGGEELKTVPRGFDRDHPRARLLRHKGLYAWQDFPPAPWLHTAKAATVVADTWRGLAPLDRWLAAHVGPSPEGGGLSR